VSAAELEGWGVAAVIYANQAIRAALRAMQRALAVMIADGRTTAIEDEIATVDELLAIGGNDLVDDTDRWFADLVEAGAS
jgi:phosphoenolpyruvate phosphomutase